MDITNVGITFTMSQAEKAIARKRGNIDTAVKEELAGRLATYIVENIARVPGVVYKEDCAEELTTYSLDIYIADQGEKGRIPV